MKICIVGASGLLGEGFQRISKDSKNEFIFCYAKNKIPNAEQLDITKEDAIKSFFQIHKPDTLINCSAISNPEFCEMNHSGQKRKKCHSRWVTGNIASSVIQNLFLL